MTRSFVLNILIIIKLLRIGCDVWQNYCILTLVLTEVLVTSHALGDSTAVNMEKLSRCSVRPAGGRPTEHGNTEDLSLILLGSPSGRAVPAGNRFEMGAL